MTASLDFYVNVSMLFNSLIKIEIESRLNCIDIIAYNCIDDWFTTKPFKPLSDQDCKRYCRFICLCFCRISICFSAVETTIEKKNSFQNYLYLTKLLRHHCESDIAIFALRVTWNYAYVLCSHFNFLFVTSETWCSAGLGFWIKLIFSASICKRGILK